MTPLTVLTTNSVLSLSAHTLFVHTCLRDRIIFVRNYIYGRFPTYSSTIEHCASYRKRSSSIIHLL